MPTYLHTWNSPFGPFHPGTWQKIRKIATDLRKEADLSYRDIISAKFGKKHSQQRQRSECLVKKNISQRAARTRQRCHPQIIIMAQRRGFLRHMHFFKKKTKSHLQWPVFQHIWGKEEVYLHCNTPTTCLARMISEILATGLWNARVKSVYC